MIMKELRNRNEVGDDRRTFTG